MGAGPSAGGVLQPPGLPTPRRRRRGVPDDVAPHHEVPEGEAALVWLYTVAYRVIGHQRRSVTRRSRLRSRLQTAESQSVVGADDTGLDDVNSRRVLAALARLKDTDAEVLRLDAWEQLSAVQP